MIYDQAFSLSNELASPFSFSVGKFSHFLSLPVCRRSSLLTGEGGGGGAKSYDSEKAWSSIINSILSGVWHSLWLGPKLYLASSPCQFRLHLYHHFNLFLDWMYSRKLTYTEINQYSIGDVFLFFLVNRRISKLFVGKSLCWSQINIQGKKCDSC